MPRPFVALAAALLLGAALAPLAALPTAGAPAAEPALAPLVWQLQRIETRNGTARAPDDPASYTVQFLPGGRLAVLADCNSGRGSWSTRDGSIEIGPIPTTRMGCGADSLDQEFLTRLQRSDAWAYREDGSLALESTADRAALVFAPQLSGVAWSWTLFQGGNDATAAPDDPTRYEIAFLPEGRLEIRADCARGAGSWSVDGTGIELAIDAVEPGACGPGSLRDRFVTDLNEVSSFVVRDGMLHLALPMDAGILSFAARVEGDDGTPGPEGEGQ